MRAADIGRRLADLPAAVAVAQLPLTATELAEAWEEREVDFQRTLVNLLVKSVTIGPATRLGPGRLDAERLAWDLRA